MNIDNNEYLYDTDGVSYEDHELDEFLNQYINVNVYANGIADIGQYPEFLSNLSTLREITLLNEFGYWN